MKAPAIEPMIYTPAKRGNVAVLVMISGPSGSGKTKSALRLARGLAGPNGTIGFCDTEHGRALYYADEFDFNHLELNEPFTPARVEAAAVSSQKAGNAVWICDSFSHEHVGPGGVLDMQEAELQRMAGDDWAKRDNMKYTAWIMPKGQHKHLVQRLWQLNSHIILCCHAEMKLDLIKNEKGKTVPNPDRTFSPVCAPDIPYAMTVSFLLDAKRPGVPNWLKRFDKIEPLIDMNKPLDEATGERIAAWARGDKKPAAAAPPPQEKTQQPPADKPPASGTEKEDKSSAIAAALIEAYRTTPDNKSHYALVDDKKKQAQVQWLRKHRPELFAQVNTAVAESYHRHQQPPAQGDLV